MVIQLLILICLFCGLIGFALGSLEGSGWVLLIYAAGAVLSLQIVYIATLLVRNMA